jgi:hypothetical protein
VSASTAEVSASTAEVSTSTAEVSTSTATATSPHWLSEADESDAHQAQ